MENYLLKIRQLFYPDTMIRTLTRKYVNSSRNTRNQNSQLQKINETIFMKKVIT